MNNFFLFLLILLNLGLAKAQEYEDEITIADTIITQHYKNMYRADSVVAAKPLTENKVYPKNFKDNLPSRYKGSDFDYSASKPRESFFEKIQRKIIQIIRAVFGETSIESSSKATALIIRIFAVILVGFLLYFIVKFLLSKNGGFFFGKKNKKMEINDDENIHEINFPQSIAQFENNGDYRSAVRYHFLFVLKKLSDKKLINWNPEKTNKDYTVELKAEHLKNDFYNLSYIFDYVWYGEFEIDENSYQKYKSQFIQFKP